MTYANPTILAITNPIGLDRVIEDLRNDLSTIPWLEKCFGRAWTFSEKDETDETRKAKLKVPKCYTSEGEYLNVLPNDNLIAQSFIACESEERWMAYVNTGPDNPKERNLNIIFWVNLKQIDPNKEYIFTEELKKDVEKVIRPNPYVKSINSFFDEKPEDVFAGYDINKDSQYLMYPYAGMRFNITVGYFEEC